MWPWRDWVINAFKSNTPYDEFVSVQLSGDMRENATKEEKLATAFNRNNPMTAEGGVIDEEWRLNYVFDRTETLGTAVRRELPKAVAGSVAGRFPPSTSSTFDPNTTNMYM